MSQTSMPDILESFGRAANSARLAIQVESYQECFGSWLARATSAEAELRLVWDGKDEHLSLQISHGPPGQHAGWLELFAAACPCGVLAEPEQSDPGFHESVAYGVQLMSPRSGNAGT
jgi:hypothetical protein